MNATVKRIVEIMFQDAEMSDEVVALKDEVMNNCQERFEDMMARGMTEDEAIAAVVDSLKGMEEVISQYPRRQPSDEELDDMDKEFDELEDEFKELDDEFEETEDNGITHLRFGAGSVSKLDINLLCEDVSIGPSNDGDIHVRYDREDMPYLRVSSSGGVLKIFREVYTNHGKKKSDVKIYVDGNQVRMSGKNMEWNSIADFANNIRQMTASMISFGRGGTDMKVELPVGVAYDLTCHSTSGDVDIDDVLLNDIMLESTSGDVTVDLMEQTEVRLMQIKGSSGDVEAKLNAKELVMQTMSGDVNFEGACPDLKISTVSGDIELDGCMEKVQAKSISGNLNLVVANDTLREINSRTTSGDLNIRLPEALYGLVKVEAKTVSGFVSNRWSGENGAWRAVVSAQSVSGDIRIK